MDLKTCVGVYLDYAKAQVLDVQDVNDELFVIESTFTSSVKHQLLQKSERSMHDAENHMKLSYFKEIIEAVKDFEHVLFFGPTNAKTELKHLIEEKYKYHKITVEIISTDEMTTKQKIAFVRKFFLR